MILADILTPLKKAAFSQSILTALNRINGKLFGFGLVSNCDADEDSPTPREKAPKCYKSDFDVYIILKPLLDNASPQGTALVGCN